MCHAPIGSPRFVPWVPPDSKIVNGSPRFRILRVPTFDFELRFFDFRPLISSRFQTSNSSELECSIIRFTNFQPPHFDVRMFELSDLQCSEVWIVEFRSSYFLVSVFSDIRVRFSIVQNSTVRFLDFILSNTRTPMLEFSISKFLKTEVSNDSCPISELSTSRTLKNECSSCASSSFRHPNDELRTFEFFNVKCSDARRTFPSYVFKYMFELPVEVTLLRYMFKLPFQ